jgi:hypothetical protein
MNRYLAAAFLFLLAIACAGCTTPQGSVAGELTLAEFSKIVVGKTRKEEVVTILGRPARAGQLRTEERETWEYRYGGGRSFWVEFDPSGVVALTNVTVDFSSSRYGGS